MNQEKKVAKCQYDSIRQCLVDEKGYTRDLQTYLNSSFGNIEFEEINKTVSMTPGMVTILMKNGDDEYQFTVPRSEKNVVDALLHCKKKKQHKNLVMTSRAKNLLIGTTVIVTAALVLGVPGKIEKVYNDYSYNNLVERMETNREDNINIITNYLVQQRTALSAMGQLDNENILNKSNLTPISGEIYDDIIETYGVDMLNEMLSGGVLSDQGRVIVDLSINNLINNSMEVAENNKSL